MTQEEVLNMLKRAKKPLKCKEISERLSKEQATISKNVKSLVSQGLIYYIEIGSWHTRFYYYVRPKPRGFLE